MHQRPLGISWEDLHIKSDDHKPEDLPGMMKPIFGAGVPKGVVMSVENLPAGKRPELNFTSISTLYHLIAVGITCAVLWGIIIATVSG